MTFDRIDVLVAQYLYLVQLLVALIYFLRQARPRQAEMVAFGVVFFPLVLIVARVAALLYFDPRPFVVGHFQPLMAHSPDNGFVSDHSLLTSAVATLVLYFEWRLGVVLWVLAALVGASRVYAGIHHPIDVLGAFAMSAILSPLAWYSARRWLAPVLARWLGRRRTGLPRSGRRSTG